MKTAKTTRKRAKVRRTIKTAAMRTAKAATLAEFPVALPVFVPVILMLVSLTSAGLAIVGVQLTCDFAARNAAQSITPSQAVQVVAKFDRDILVKFLGPFVKEPDADKPVLTLVTEKRSARAGEIEVHQIIMYRVSASYNLQPLFVPKLFPMQTEAFAIVEHPEGL